MKNFLLGLFVALPFLALAEPHYISNLSVPEGLGDLLVNCIHEEADGMIWIGTGCDVESFDGVHIRQYALPGETGPHKRVTAIAGDRRNGLWAGNGYGLWQYSDRTDGFEQVFREEIAGEIKDMTTDSAGTLYVATTLGLYTLTEGQLIHYRLPSASIVTTADIPAISLDEEGTLWIITYGGLMALMPPVSQEQKNERRQLVQYQTDIPDGGYTSIAARGGTVWLGTFHHGLDAFDPHTARFRHVQDVLAPISALQVCADDRLLIGTDGAGILMLDTHTEKITKMYSQHTPGRSRLTSNSVYSVLLDSRGVLWAGLYQNGLDYTLWQGDDMHVHRTAMFDSEGIAVRSLCIYGQQRLIGTRQGLYFIDKATNRFRFFGEKELHAQMVFAICRYAGEYLIGTYGGGLLALQPETMELSKVGLPVSQTGLQVFSLTEDGQGRLWVGTEKGAFCMIRKGGKWQIAAHYNARNSQLPAGIVYHIYFDQMNRGWLCTANGMALYDPETATVSRENFPQSFPSASIVRQVWQAQDGVIYFIPDKGEIFAVDEEWRQQVVPDIEGHDGLFITDDGRGAIVIGTNNGLYYHRTDGTKERYDFSDGLPSSIFTLCQPQIDEEGTVWLGNSRGLVWFKPDSIHFPRLPRHVSVPRIRQFGNASTITAELSDFSFTYPACMRYEYRLEGEDVEWHLLSGVSDHTWQNLRPGQYTLRVRFPGNEESEVSVKIRVPLSKEAVLSIVLGIIALLLIGGYLVRRIRILKVRKAAQREREAALAAAEAALNSKEAQKYKTTNLPVSELRRLKKALDELMTNEQLYLNPELKLSDLANRMNTSSFVLSYLFNQHMNTSFYDYINNFRVENFKQRVKSGEAKSYSLDALATKCGYNSRTSFFRNFKKATGQTPSEYIGSKN